MIKWKFRGKNDYFSNLVKYKREKESKTKVRNFEAFGCFGTQKPGTK